MKVTIKTRWKIGKYGLRESSATRALRAVETRRQGLVLWTLLGRLEVASSLEVASMQAEKFSADDILAMIEEATNLVIKGEKERS